MAYTAFSLAPPSLADHLTWGNLCRHAATEIAHTLITIKGRVVEAVLDRRSFLGANLALAAITQFSENNTVKAVCATGWTLLNFLRPVLQGEQVKAVIKHTVEAFNKSNSAAKKANEIFAETVGKISRVDRTIANLLRRPGTLIIGETKNNLIKTQSDIQNQVFELEELKKTCFSHIHNSTQIAKAIIEHLNETREKNVRFSTATLFLVMGSALIDADRMLPLVLFGMSVASYFSGDSKKHLENLEYLASSNQRSSLSLRDSLTPYIMNWAKAEQQIGEAENALEKSRVSEAAEDFFERFDSKLAPLATLCSKAAKELNQQMQKLRELQPNFSNLTKEYNELLDLPRGFVRVRAGELLSQCENRKELIRQYYLNGEEEKLRNLVKKFSKFSNLVGSIRLHCIAAIETRFSHHPNFPEIAPLLRDQKRLIAKNAKEVVKAFDVYKYSKAMLLEFEETLARVTEKLIRIKYSSPSAPVTGGHYSKDSKKFG